MVIRSIVVFLMIIMPGALLAAPSHHRTVLDVAGMVHDPHAQSLAHARGLGFVNILWEDTGRYIASSVGPNISDVTIEVEHRAGSGRTRIALMPVLRYPNFTDRTADLRLDTLRIRVGNERKGGGLITIGLLEYLRNPTHHMAKPWAGRIKGGSLLAPRDTHALVSAQAAFLPVPRGAKVRFRPVLFNYQSFKNNPAVLVLLVTREGTSMTVVDNSRDTIGEQSWGQRLFFNERGRSAPLTAERRGDAVGKAPTADGRGGASVGDANMLMLIQIPLKAKPRVRYFGDELDDLIDNASSGGARRSDVEAAVLGHGKTEGPFTELAGLTVERDPRFPIRVTIQFYQATSNGAVSREDIETLAAQINKVYSDGDYVGSLVVPEGPQRPTIWTGATGAPPDLSWRDFAGLVDRFSRFGPWGLVPWSALPSVRPW